MTTPTRPVLVIKHIDIEGPGTLGNFMEKNNVPYRVLDAHRNDSYEEEPANFSAIISLGGPMGVNDDVGVYPFLRWEDAFLRRAIQEEVPTLGICLGAQILARAADARVTRAPAREIGWFDVSLTEDGRADPLFEGLPDWLLVFQWHGDTFEIPQGGRWLAKSDVCPHQAFRVGANAYGLQFHLEVTPQMICRWMDAYKEELDLLEDAINPGKIVRQSEDYSGAYSRQAEQLYRNFFRIRDAFHS